MGIEWDLFKKSPVNPRQLLHALDFETVPDNIDDQTKYLRIPHKNGLYLGVALVFEFMAERCPSAEDKVRAMFRKRGAYSRFIDWAERHDFLDNLYRFEKEVAFEKVKIILFTKHMLTTEARCSIKSVAIVSANRSA
jgi:hypothetical protein